MDLSKKHANSSMRKFEELWLSNRDKSYGTLRGLYQRCTHWAPAPADNSAHVVKRKNAGHVMP